MAETLEIIMLLCFGASWPVNLIKSCQAKTAKGKSPIFLIFIILGYLAGILSKLFNSDYMASFGSNWYVMFFYVLNMIMAMADLLIYARNKKLDKARESE